MFKQSGRVGGEIIGAGDDAKSLGQRLLLARVAPLHDIIVLHAVDARPVPPLRRRKLPDIAYPALREGRRDQLDHHTPGLSGQRRQVHHQQIGCRNRHPVRSGRGGDDLRRRERGRFLGRSGLRGECEAGERGKAFHACSLAASAPQVQPPRPTGLRAAAACAKPCAWQSIASTPPASPACTSIMSPRPRGRAEPATRSMRSSAG